ncbi:MAG: hypothetical protein OSJ73_18410 [Lachnospiraceae bacterium]|nr:hypothetical protein [Lachnospiraceae bacterium]
MNFKKPSRLRIILTVTLIAIMSMGVFAMGVYASSVDKTSTETQMETTGKPSLELDIRSATVEVVTITENKVSAEYNKDIYDVVISDNNDVWKVNISCKTEINTNQEIIKLYIPDFDYDKVNMNIKNAGFTCASLKSGNIIGDFNMATVVLTLPEDFTGSLDAISTTAEFSLISQDNFKDTNVTIVDDGGWGDDEIYVPQSFKKRGNIYTYTNGTESNIIKVTKKNAGMIGFYLANEFNVIEFPY